VALFSQLPQLCTDLDPTLLYILILGTYSKFAWKNKKLQRSAFDSRNNAALVQQQKWNYFFLFVLFFSILNQRVANLQEILSSFGVLQYRLSGSQEEYGKRISQQQ